jgi:aspartate ammonia-lyase
VYYGIQTLRAVENFRISGIPISRYPEIVDSLAIVKQAAAIANYEQGLLPQDIYNAIIQTCKEIRVGKFHFHFVVDMIQGGAGTSTNMNANEVIANRALEILGYKKGEYEFCHPNNHVNLSQSTNDAYPTAMQLAIYYANQKLTDVLKKLVTALRNKEKEFSNIVKMGRTQLQDAVPMTLGQSFGAFATAIESEIQHLDNRATLLLEINMGATAIGTGINTEKGYSEKVLKALRIITGLDLKLARNLIEATSDTGAFVSYSSTLKRLAVKISKICNDLRLLSSGPRCGLGEINLPPIQPGSSIMPGKVNPVIPEALNQIAYSIIGNDLTVTMASEAAQLELNVMEPIMIYSIFQSIEMLKRGIDILTQNCITGITANEKRCRDYVENSIGLITALNPYIGYEASSRIAQKALETNKSVYELVLEEKLLSKEELEEYLKPENMIR